MNDDKPLVRQIVLILKNETHENIENSIAALNQPLANLHIGLPTENILLPIQFLRQE